MKNSGASQIKYGALISYVLIIGNALFGLIVTPYVLRLLGASAYGVYKTIGSFSNSLVVLDLGLGGTLMRYIAKYRANQEQEKIGPFVSMMTCEAAVLLPVIALVEVFLYFQLDGFYGSSFSPTELTQAKQIFIILSCNVLVSIAESFLNGIITGHNNFVLGNGMKLMKLLAKIGLIFVLLPLTRDPLTLVTINLALSVAGLIVQLVFIVRRYSIDLSFDTGTWETGIFRESLSYTLLTFLTVMAAQVNGNLDNVIIGAFCGAEQVTVYSFGLVIFGMFEQLSTSISGVVLPTVSKIVAQDNWKQQAQEFVVRIGRVQFMLLGAAVVGFVVLGKDFLTLWLGSGFEDVYLIVLILMLPSLFELCVNVCLAILRAQNKLGFRTTVLALSTLLNLVVSVAGIRRIGYFSAAVGTAVSFAVGSLLVMNLYYYKKFGFRMLRIYGRIMKGTGLCLVAAGAVTAVTARWLSGSWLTFAGNVVVFAVVYAGTMLLFGMNKAEIKEIRKILGKREAKVS